MSEDEDRLIGRTIAGMGEVRPANVRTWTAPNEGVSRNVFAVETESGFVVDAPMRNSDGEAAREWLVSLGKPVLAVLVTHAHPDHNSGLTRMLKGMDVPIYATAAVAEGVHATEEPMQRLVRGNFGHADIESDRLFPNAVADPARPVVIDGVPFLVSDAGAMESPAASVWTTPALPGVVFAGDLVMHRTHYAFIQANSAGYLATARRLKQEAEPGTIFFPGHGGLVPVSAIDRQVAHFEAYRDAVGEVAQGRATLDEQAKAELVRHMRTLEPSPVLSMHIALGADAVAGELATRS